MYPRAPFVRLLFPFVLGILAAGFWQIRWHHAFLLSCLSLMFVLLYQAIRSDKEKFIQRQHYGLIMNMALFFAGYFITCADEQYLPEGHISYFVDTTRLIECTIEEKPVEKAKSFRAFASIESVVVDSVPSYSTGGIVIYFQKCKALLILEAGQKLYCFADLKSPPQALNPCEFDYASYLKKKGITVQTYIDSTSWKLLDPGIHGRFANRFVRWRDKMLEEMRPYVASGDVFEVLSALILGKTSELDRELMSHYSGAGAIHVLAVSGLHVGLIYLFLLQLLGFIFKERLKLLRVFIIALFLWIYAAISGFSPSVLRSTVMFTAILIGTGINRNSDIFNSLSSSAFLLLGYDPTMIYDIGFQLSYLAVLGIVLFQKGFESLWYIKTGIIYKLWQLSCVSLAAQVITYPIGLYYFGQFPNYFLIANLIVIPLSTGILYVAILFFAVFWIPWLAKPVGQLLSIATEWLNAIVTFTDQLPGSRTEDVSLNLPWALFLMGVSCWIMLIWQRRWWKQLSYLLLVLSSAFLLSASSRINRAFEKPILCFHSLKEGIGITYAQGASVFYFHEGDSLADKSIVDRKLRAYWRSLNRGEVKFVNLKDSSVVCPTVFVKSNEWLSVRDLVVNFEPRKIIETYEVPEIVLMNSSHFVKDSVLIRGILSDCDYFVLGADVKEYKWKKIQEFLTEQEKAKVYYLGNGALIFEDKKVKQQKGAP